MNAQQLKLALQLALEKLSDVPDEMPIHFNGPDSDGLDDLASLTVYYANAEGNEQDAGEECKSVVVAFD
jgi:hypothetical protein